MFSKKELKPVYPKTYEEAVDYLDGKRRITRISNSLWNSYQNAHILLQNKSENRGYTR